jgi:hypothetical protein
MGFLLKGHNAFEAGVPATTVRTGAQAEKYNAARARGENPKLGKKTGVYGQHLDPTQPQATTGTNDIWHARGFGYTNADGGTFSRALSDQEHRFLDYETMLAVGRANDKKLGGRSDWTGAEIQAAPWVAGKGRGEAKKRNIGPPPQSWSTVIVRKRRIRDGERVRTIYKHHWSGPDSREKVDAALAILEQHNIVRRDMQATGGRPIEIIRLPDQAPIRLPAAAGAVVRSVR